MARRVYNLDVEFPNFEMLAIAQQPIERLAVSFNIRGMKDGPEDCLYLGDVLADGLVGSERTAGELVESSGLSQSALSQHLAKLRQEHLVETRRDGRTIHYRLANGQTAKLIETLHNLYCGRK